MTKRVNVNDPFTTLTLDLIIEILLKLPAKSIARLSFVSKHWKSIVCSETFTKLYMTRSLSRPRLLLGYNEHDKLILDSVSQQDQSSDHQKVSIASYGVDDLNIFGICEPVRGLVCLRRRNRMMIGNPSTSQFLTFLNVETRSRISFSVFGYDPVNEVFKVLCMTVPMTVPVKANSLPPVYDEHLVLTLGHKQKWRKITCKHPHTPYACNGICINGGLYYYALVNYERCLIYFDLTSEDFIVVKLSKDIHGVFMVNYNGKLALCSEMYGATLNLWILQDAKKQEWSKVSHVVPSWIDLVGDTTLRFKGILSTGQLVFAPSRSYSQYFFISYDLKENTAKKVVIEGITKESQIVFYFDHIQNPMVLSNSS